MKTYNIINYYYTHKVIVPNTNTTAALDKHGVFKTVMKYYLF